MVVLAVLLELQPPQTPRLELGLDFSELRVHSIQVVEGLLAEAVADRPVLKAALGGWGELPVLTCRRV